MNVLYLCLLLNDLLQFNELEHKYWDYSQIRLLCMTNYFIWIICWFFYEKKFSLGTIRMLSGCCCVRENSTMRNDELIFRATLTRILAKTKKGSEKYTNPHEEHTYTEKLITKKYIYFQVFEENKHQKKATKNSTHSTTLLLSVRSLWTKLLQSVGRNVRM